MQSDLHKHLCFKDYCIRRLSKVYMPVLLCTAIWLLIATYTGCYKYESAYKAVYDLFWGFGDGALWFIRVILLMYLAFYVFSSMRPKYGIQSHIIFVLSLFAIYVCTSILEADWAAISIPLFYIGTLASVNKSIPYKGILLPLIGVSVLVCGASLFFFSKELAAHAFINYVMMIGLFLILLHSSWSKRIKCPVIMGAISFDIYLVHNKCINEMKHFFSYFGIWEWAITSIILAFAFYYFRTKLINKQ